MTFLPIIETLESDLTAYVPTNLVSMTDGQIFTSAALFSEGFKPAVHIGLSVSRVGSKAQWPLIKKLSGGVRLDYIQYKELLEMTKLQTDISEEVKRSLKKGKVLVSFITQGNNSPLSLVEQAFLFFAYKNEMLLDLSEEDIERYKLEIFSYVKQYNSKLIKEIEDKKKLEPEIEKGMRETITAFIRTLPSYKEKKEEMKKEEQKEGKNVKNGSESKKEEKKEASQSETDKKTEKQAKK